MRDSESHIYIGQEFKFIHYALNPECNVSIRICHPDLNKDLTRFQVWHSILNKSCKKSIADILTPLGGGGHDKAGGVTVNSENAKNTYETYCN